MKSNDKIKWNTGAPGHRGGANPQNTTACTNAARQAKELPRSGSRFHRAVLEDLCSLQDQPSSRYIHLDDDRTLERSRLPNNIPDSYAIVTRLGVDDILHHPLATEINLKLAHATH
jgi:hypothetical protein